MFLEFVMFPFVRHLGMRQIQTNINLQQIKHELVINEMIDYPMILNH